MAAEVGKAYKHIVAVVRQMPDFATLLPGGIHRHVAPASATYPHLVMAYATGTDVQGFSGGFIGTGMDMLVKVIDKSNSAENAQGVFDAVESALLEHNGENMLIRPGVFVGAFVTFDRLSPLDLPVVENDVIYQQIGRMFRVFVDNVE